MLPYSTERFFGLFQVKKSAQTCVLNGLVSEIKKFKRVVIIICLFERNTAWTSQKLGKTKTGFSSSDEIKRSHARRYQVCYVLPRMKQLFDSSNHSQLGETNDFRCPQRKWSKGFKSGALGGFDFNFVTLFRVVRMVTHAKQGIFMQEDISNAIYRFVKHLQTFTYISETKPFRTCIYGLFYLK